MSSPTIQPYLFFAGRCDEALAFYQSALGAKIDLLMRYNECPTPMPPGSIPAGFEKKVMHVTFRVGSNVLMASDGDDTDLRFEGVSLSLSVANEAEARRAFDALASGGEVKMPLGKTFWSPCFGMLKDRFGIGWMVGVQSSS